MDPIFGQALLAAAPGFGEGLGKSLGGQPSSSLASGTTSFDSSGWNVNFGAGAIDSTRGAAGDLGAYMPWVIGALAVVLVLKAARK